MGISVDFTGFPKAKTLLNKIPRVLEQQVFMRKVAQKLVEILKQRIITHGMYLVNVPFEPNADATVEKKGFDYPYYETGEFLNAIKMEKGNDQWFVGVKGGNLEYAASINEYGGFDRDGSPYYIPPRRLFSDVIASKDVENVILIITKSSLEKSLGLKVEYGI